MCTVAYVPQCTLACTVKPEYCIKISRTLAAAQLSRHKTITPPTLFTAYNEKSKYTFNLDFFLPSVITRTFVACLDLPLCLTGV